MFKFLQTYIDHYLQRSKSVVKSNEHILNEDNNPNPYIQFILNDDNKIEISCGIQHESDLDNDVIIELSERYAELLLGINKSLLKNDIIEILKKESKKTEDYKKILLIDNIISFYETMQKEQLKSYAFYNLPVVLPSMAFRDPQS